MNLDPKTVTGFGEEWSQFDQSALSPEEIQEHFDKYFAIFPWHLLPLDAQGFDVGCGSGRWARAVAPKVQRLHCIDASEAALEVASRNLADLGNCEFHHASVDHLPLPDGSMDFGYSLGVLHHVPDPEAALAECVRKLKPGAPFLLYVYYALENRSAWFRSLWRATDLLRHVISAMPHRVKYLITTVIALFVYWPLARAARVLDRRGVEVDSFPLSIYRTRSLYSMRTDAFDRFSTRLEKRFTADELRHMMTNCDLAQVALSDGPPYWCAVGFRSDPPNV